METILLVKAFDIGLFLNFRFSFLLRSPAELINKQNTLQQLKCILTYLCTETG